MKIVFAVNVQHDDLRSVKGTKRIPGLPGKHKRIAGAENLPVDRHAIGKDAGCR